MLDLVEGEYCKELLSSRQWPEHHQRRRRERTWWRRGWKQERTSIEALASWETIKVL
jgi:hypothetical protein